MSVAQSEGRSSISNPGLLILAVSLLLGAVAVVVLIVIMNGGIQLTASRLGGIVLVGISLLLTGSVLAVASLRSGNDSLEIVFPYTLLYILHFPLRALFIFVWPNEATYLVNWPPNALPYISGALTLSILGMFSFYVGYFAVSSGNLLKVSPKTSFNWTEDGLMAKTLVLYIAGLLGLATLALTSTVLHFQWFAGRGTQSFYYPLLLLDDLRPIALFLAWAKLRHSSALGLVVTWIMTLLEVAIGIIIGSKLTIFVAILAMIFAFHYFRPGKYRQTLLISSLLFFFVIFPMVQTYRSVYNDVLGYRPDPSVGDFVDIGDDFVDTVESSIDKWFFISIKSVANRASNLDSLTMIVRYVPSVVPYQKGETITLVFAGMVPRFLWPDKPILTLGSYMNDIIVGSPARTNLPLTDMGELYLNFGVAGVPVGMFFLGIFLQVMYTAVRKLDGSPEYRTLIYFAIFPTLLLSFQSGMAAALVALTRIGLIMIGLRWFLLGGKIRASLNSQTDSGLESSAK